jgi:hypothetical protein
MSFVEVSPSTLTWLYEVKTEARKAFCNISGEMAQSVARNESIVAMFGLIIPEPFAMPPSVIFFPSISNCAAQLFGNVSVVIIASAAGILSRESDFTSLGIPATITSTGNGNPITPVEFTIMSDALIFNSLAAALTISIAAESPFGAAVLALPELQRIARAFPFLRCSMVSKSGAPFTLLVV